MTTTETVRRTPARTVQVAGLVTAAVGVIVLILVGVPGFPLIPPGPIILLVAAAVISVCGLAEATYLTVIHLTGETVLCGGSSDCSQVLASKYAAIGARSRNAASRRRRCIASPASAVALSFSSRGTV